MLTAKIESGKTLLRTNNPAFVAKSPDSGLARLNRDLKKQVHISNAGAKQIFNESGLGYRFNTLVSSFFPENHGNKALFGAKKGLSWQNPGVRKKI